MSLKLPDGFSPHFLAVDVTKPEYSKNVYQYQFRNLRNISGWGSFHIPKEVSEEQAMAIMRQMLGMDFKQ